MPKRIQQKRTKGWRKPENCVYVGRPTRYGNPFKVGETWHETDGTPHVIADSETAISEFRSYLRAKLIRDPEFLEPLRGKDLSCWCNESKACHVDVILDFLSNT